MIVSSPGIIFAKSCTPLFHNVIDPSPLILVQHHPSDFKLQTSSFRPQTSDFSPQPSTFRLHPSDLNLPTSDFRPHLSDLIPQTSNFIHQFKLMPLTCPSGIAKAVNTFSLSWSVALLSSTPSILS